MILLDVEWKLIGLCVYGIGEFLSFWDLVVCCGKYVFLIYCVSVILMCEFLCGWLVYEFVEKKGDRD